MGVKLGPIVLGTLLRHYLGRQNVTRDSKARNELLFDEAFIVLKVSFRQLVDYDVFLSFYLVVHGGEYKAHR
jgi:hypothetical protein